MISNRILNAALLVCTSLGSVAAAQAGSTPAQAPDQPWYNCALPRENADKNIYIDRKILDIYLRTITVPGTTTNAIQIVFKPMDTRLVRDPVLVSTTRYYTDVRSLVSAGFYVDYPDGRSLWAPTNTVAVFPVGFFEQAGPARMGIRYENGEVLFYDCTRPPIYAKP